MNDDQSFYEIQLNTPHLFLAFLGAAVVGVALFWLGVIIGRGQSATAAPSDWRAAVPVEETGDDAGSEPADFFDESGESSAAVPADDSAADDPTADLATANDPTTNAPVEEPETDPPAEAGSFQPADPVAEEPAPVVATSQSGLPPADASLVTGWVIQVRSTPEEGAANALQESLSNAGFPAFVISAEVDGTTWYRVRVGRYGTRADADVVEAALMQRADIQDAWVTEG